MARGTTLEDLLNRYRSEARLSLNVAQNIQVRETQIALLRRTQQWLWEDFDWPHLRGERQYKISAGQRYYDFTDDFDIERIGSIQCKDGGIWRPLCVGIDAPEYNTYDSDLDQRSFPLRRFRLYENDQIEVWPISDRNGDDATRDNYLKVTGILKLPPLVNDNDRAVIDDILITLFAAVETLGAAGAKDAPAKLNLANSRYTRLRSQLSKKRVINVFGVTRPQRARPYAISEYKPPVVY